MILAIAGLALTTACDKTDRSFSILAANDTFKQIVVYTPRPIDILWVVDNSGSMAPSQQNLIDNFPVFIDRFQSKGYDFHMAVQTSDAWLGKFQGNDSRRRFRTGNGAGLGTYVMDKNTSNLPSVFSDIALQGTSGSGDERAFSSFLDTLDFSGNSGFRRNDAFLTVIILSDEDDFSATNAAWGGDSYSNPNLIPVSNYKTFLDGYAGEGNYNVNLIAILDQTCDNTFPSNGAQKIGVRYKQLVDLVNTGISTESSKGIQTSICDDFGTNLDLIASTSISANVVFQLDRIPKVETITVRINNVLIPQDASNGWTYDSVANSITLHGNSVPADGDNINIDYDPAGLGQ
jgi:hypothetical protein